MMIKVRKEGIKKIEYANSLRIKRPTLFLLCIPIFCVYISVAIKIFGKWPISIDFDNCKVEWHKYGCRSDYWAGLADGRKENGI